MFIPYSTDAPLYYRPIGTLSLIALNCLIFVALISRPELHQSLSLPHGQGLTPIPWVTSNLIHMNAGHLIGNMIFLWSFGLIVEGKIGWARFAAVYFAIGAIQCIAEQILFWNGEGISCGASAVIFGLMAICLIWAPQSDLSVAYVFMFRPGVIEISILWFAALTLAKSGLMISMDTSNLSELFHLMGAGVGLAIACYMIRTQMVDCEGWDLFSVLKKQTPIDKAQFSWQHRQDAARRRNTRTATRTQLKKSSSPNVLTQPQTAEKLTELALNGKPHAAYQLLQKILRKSPEQPIAAETLYAIAGGLRKRKEWDSSAECYRLLLKQVPTHPNGRLELAEIYAFLQHRPAAATRLLEQLPEDQLSNTELSRLKLASEKISELREEGVIEFQERT